MPFWRPRKTPHGLNRRGSMPHTKSAKKHQRQSEKRRMANRATKKALKTQIKRFLAAETEGTPDKLQAEYNLAAKKLDKAAAKRVIHPNQASRKKSQVAKLLNGKEKAPAKAAPSAPAKK
jgi:small subunit ribosomal protein S20